MTNRDHRTDPLPRPKLQLPMAFTTRPALDATQRAAVVGLLSRLLLQVAAARSQSEVANDHA